MPRSDVSLDNGEKAFLRGACDQRLKGSLEAFAEGVNGRGTPKGGIVREFHVSHEGNHRGEAWARGEADAPSGSGRKFGEGGLHHEYISQLLVINDQRRVIHIRKRSGGGWL